MRQQAKRRFHYKSLVGDFSPRSGVVEKGCTEILQKGSREETEIWSGNDDDDAIGEHLGGVKVC